MSSSLGDFLRSSMRDATASVRADEEYLDRLVGQSRRARRRRQRVTWIGAAVTAIAVIVGVSLLPPVLTGSSTPSDGTASAPSNADPLEWARSLPEGAASRLDYLAGSVLQSGELSVPVPGDFDQAEFIGSTSQGWLIFVEHWDKAGIPTQTSYGILTPDGQFEALPDDPYDGSPEVQVLSPSGELFATGGALINLQSRSVVGQVPDNARYASQWTAAGLEYLASPGGPSWLWNPGEPPIQLGATLEGMAADGRRALTAPQGGCTEIVDVGADGSLHTAYRACAADEPISLSPGGTYALTRNFSVVDVDQGTVEALTGVPDRVIQRGWAWWEDDTHLIVPAESPPASRTADGAASGPRTVILVRCSIATAECARASEEFKMPYWQYLDLK
jgi:hypothetical protein